MKRQLNGSMVLSNFGPHFRILIYEINLEDSVTSPRGKRQNGYGIHGKRMQLSDVVFPCSGKLFPEMLSLHSPFTLPRGVTAITSHGIRSLIATVTTTTCPHAAMAASNASSCRVFEIIVIIRRMVCASSLIYLLSNGRHGLFLRIQPIPRLCEIVCRRHRTGKWPTRARSPADCRIS